MSDMAIESSSRRFSVQEYHRMAEAEILTDRERVELLDGIVTPMSPIGGGHWLVHALLSEYLIGLIGQRALVVPQGSFPLGDRNEPQPDIAIFDRRAARDPTARGDARNLLAIVEISDSSLRRDLGFKVGLYARFAIPDYVVVDLGNDRLLHHGRPHELGYETVRELRRGDTFEMACFPELPFEATPFLNPT